MVTSGQTNNKVLLPLGPMIENFKGKLNMLQEWTIRELVQMLQEWTIRELVRASDKVFLLHVGKFPQSIESAGEYCNCGWLPLSGNHSLPCSLYSSLDTHHTAFLIYLCSSLCSY
jgi:hypothetical protein